jgi:hypothetical protein
VRPGFHQPGGQRGANAHVRAGPFHARRWIGDGKARGGCRKAFFPRGDERSASEAAEPFDFERGQLSTLAEMLGELGVIGLERPVGFQRHFRRKIPDVEMADNGGDRPAFEGCRLVERLVVKRHYQRIKRFRFGLKVSGQLSHR